MRLQNTMAAVVFIILLACASVMQLLNFFPGNSTLWYLNLTFAREARPVLELFDYLPFASLTQNLSLIGLLIGLCVLATYRKNKLLTSATTHIALYGAIFAGIASYSRTFGSMQAASNSASDMIAFTTALDPSQRALTAIVAIMLITCLMNHYQIISELLREQFRRGQTGNIAAKSAT